MASRGCVGSGDVYINRKVNDVPQGIKGPFEADKFEIKPNVDKKELVSKGKYTYGQTLETVQLQKPTEFSLTLKEINRESLTLALLGTSSVEAAQTGGSLTAVSVTIPKKDIWVPLTKGNLTGAATVTNSAGGTTYVEGTDYVLNRQLGMIKIISTSAIADGDIVKLTSTYGAYTGTVIAGSTNVDIRAEILFDGINQADGSPVFVRVREAIVSADSAFDFLADDFNSLELKGTMKTPVGQTDPFTVSLRNYS